MFSILHPKPRFQSVILCCVFLWFSGLNAQSKPLDLGVIGLSHSHVHWVFNSVKGGNFTISGIVEPNRELALKYAEQYNFPLSRIYDSMDALYKERPLEAVAAFGPISEHLSIVEYFAPKGIHIMVEKPMAVNFSDAERMAALARKHQVHLLTNYETTWYPTNHKAYEILKHSDKIGKLRKVIVRDGHKGPKRIGVEEEFLEWLTDPDKNGAGALMDFGCYGANLATWLMEGKRPLSVTAVMQQLQPENNPKVDDEAVIILQYPESLFLIQPSWNWTVGRKDMEIYGTEGILLADNRNRLRIRLSEGYDGFDEELLDLEERPSPLNDPFDYFAAVIQGEVTLNPFALSGLDNNLLSMEILQAALQSAQNGKTVWLKK